MPKGPREWSPRKPLQFTPIEKETFRGLVLSHPEPERFYILGSTLVSNWTEIQLLFEDKKVPKNLEQPLRRMQRDIEDVLRGTPWEG